MKNNLTIVMTSCIVLLIFVLLFPFRTAELKVPGETDSSASLGPLFIFTSPKKIKIYNAIFESNAKEIDNEWRYYYALQSRIDYGRTLMLIMPLIAGALGSFFWIRKTDITQNLNDISTRRRKSNYITTPPIQGERSQINSQDYNKKVIPNNSSSQLPENISKQVCYGTAKYRIFCPKCKNNSLVRGKLLRSKEIIHCPYENCRLSMSTNKLSMVQIEGEFLVYRRIADFFSYEGRISVGDYWLSILVALPIMILAKVLTGPLYPLILFGVLHPLWIKRYHDHGFKSVWVTVQAITMVTSMLMAAVMPSVLNRGETYPLLGFVHALALLFTFGTGIMISFVPGKKGLNRYGPSPSQIKRVWL